MAIENSAGIYGYISSGWQGGIVKPAVSRSYKYLKFKRFRYILERFGYIFVMITTYNQE
jgi:hypothetical protein